MVGFLHIIPPDFDCSSRNDSKIRQAVIHVKVDKDNLIEDIFVGKKNSFIKFIKIKNRHVLVIPKKPIEGKYFYPVAYI